MGLTSAMRPVCSPVPATCEAVPPVPPNPMWWAPVLFPPGTNRPQVGIGIEGTRKLLGIDFAVLVQNMGIHTGDHVDLSVAGIALGGLQVAVMELQLVGGTGMTERVKNHF